MASGGAREGAGRKSKAEKYSAPINEAEGKIADRLPDLVDNLLALADGGFEQVTEVYEPAGTIIIDATETEYDGGGKPRSIRIKRKAFPDKKSDELVLVKRTVSIAAPDAGANQYLIDRLMGRPTQPHEFANMTDAEIIEAATAAFGRDAEAGDCPPTDSNSE